VILWFGGLEVWRIGQKEECPVDILLSALCHVQHIPNCVLTIGRISSYLSILCVIWIIIHIYIDVLCVYHAIGKNKITKQKSAKSGDICSAQYKVQTQYLACHTKIITHNTSPNCVLMVGRISSYTYTLTY